MNQKLCKKLRKAAHRAALQAEFPVIEYLKHKVRGNIIVDPKTERGIYLHYKKMFRGFAA